MVLLENIPEQSARPKRENESHQRPAGGYRESWRRRQSGSGNDLLTVLGLLLI